MSDKYIRVADIGIGVCNPDVFNDKGYAKGWNAAVEIVMNTPAADVRPVVKHVTNYDRVTHMSIEELAEFGASLGCYPTAHREVCIRHFYDGVADCNNCWLDWLREEAEE